MKTTHCRRCGCTTTTDVSDDGLCTRCAPSKFSHTYAKARHPIPISMVRWHYEHPTEAGDYLAAWPDGTIETVQINEDDLTENGEWTERCHPILKDATHWSDLPEHPRKCRVSV